MLILVRQSVSRSRRMTFSGEQLDVIYIYILPSQQAYSECSSYINLVHSVLQSLSYIRTSSPDSNILNTSIQRWKDDTRNFFLFSLYKLTSILTNIR